MAEFCHTCSLAIFGEDFGDFAGLCKAGERVRVLCEGCGGEITVDHDGHRVQLPHEPTQDHGEKT